MSIEETSTEAKDVEEEVIDDDTNDTDTDKVTIVKPSINIRKGNKTPKQLIKDSKQRAIEKFKRGEIDDEWRVVLMSNGKYRTYKRKEPLTPTPINVNQVKVNKPTPDDVHDKRGLDLDIFSSDFGISSMSCV